MKKHKISSYIPIFLSISILIYTLYRSEIYWDGGKREYYYYFYLFSGILILFSVFYLFLEKRIKIYITITLVTSIFCFYFFEAYLLLENSLCNKSCKKNLIYEKDTGKKYDNRKRFEAYSDLKKELNELVPLASPAAFVLQNETSIFPFSGISNSITFGCNENGYYSKYKSDRYGFNNPDGEWDKKEFEYVLVGDSFTNGACVNRPNDTGSVLRKLSKKNVLNLGYNGNGPLIEYAVLREYLPKNVKNILWMYFEGNDIAGLQKELTSKILVKYLDDINYSQDLVNKVDKIDKILIKKLNDVIKKKEAKEKINVKTLKILKFIKLENLRNMLIKYPAKQAVPNNKFEEVLKLAKKISIENNSNLYFVYLPRYSRYTKKYNNSSYNEIKKIIQKLNIELIDIHKEVFAVQENPLNLFPFEMYGHYNQLGYKKIAEHIFKKISNNNY